jgi:hypothetical protein
MEIVAILQTLDSSGVMLAVVVKANQWSLSLRAKLSELLEEWSGSEVLDLGEWEEG